MLYPATLRWTKVSRIGKNISRNMQKSTEPHSNYPLIERELVENAFFSNVPPFSYLSPTQHTILYNPARSFSKTANLLHDIKCVTTSYYEDLGLESNASSKEIKEAFYRQDIHGFHGM